jgi:glycine cleavage system H protein
MNPNVDDHGGDVNVPEALRYTASHEWIRTEADGTVTIGITDHAQEALGDLVFIELPDVGRTVAAEEACAVVESVKAASDIYAPIAGEVVAVNADLPGTPELVNQDAYAAWLFKLKPADAGAVGKLLDAAAYKATIDEG